MTKTSKRATWLRVLPGLLAGSIGIAACGDDDIDLGNPGADASLDDGAAGKFSVRVRRTENGVPHIQADDFGSLGYGYGYTFSDDNLCVLAEEILTSRGQRAKYFGDVAYDLGNSSASSNVSSDAYFRMVFTKEVADKYRASQTEELRSLVAGYAAGVSRYVRELKAGEHPGRHQACRNEAWVREIDDEDLYLRFYKLNLIASSAGFINGFAAAVPPAPARRSPPRPAPERAPTPKPPTRAQLADVADGMRAMLPKLFEHREGELGSNMYAFGSELTGGAGIQFGNPHFPWYGGERLYQVHLTVPGKMNVQGSSLYGVPAVLIGFTENFAWSHTVSTAYRFTPYQLKLKEGDPLTYLQDGVEKPITPVDFDIEVKQADGSVSTVATRLYKSEYGPMIRLSSNERFAWDATQAFTIRDANAENFRLITNFFRWNKASSLEEFEQIHRELVAVPWVNTTAADRNGRVYYGDLTVVPNVSDAKAAACAGSRAAFLASGAPGLPLLDGSRAECNWDRDADAPADQPDILGPSHLPSMNRSDWVVNCNDSYWLTNPKQPMPAFAKIVGLTDTEQSLRSRMCHQQITDRLAGTDGFAGTGVTVDIVKQMVLGGRAYAAEKFRPQVLAGICTETSLTLGADVYLGKPLSGTVDITAACNALRDWDGRNDPDSVGSLAWDEFWFRMAVLQGDETLRPFAVAFDPAQPLDTPRDLDTSKEYVRAAFAAAVHAVQQAGFDFAIPRREISYRLAADGSKIPVLGGYQRNGSFTIGQVRSPVLTAGSAWGPVNYGNSYLQVVGFLPDGKLDANTFVTYSQSIDPASPHFADYSQHYAKKEWLRAAFTESEIAAQVLEGSDVTLRGN